MDTYVVIGGGLAGAKAVETLRAEGFAGRLVLVAEETEDPYERPPLSKGYLLGSAGIGDWQPLGVYGYWLGLVAGLSVAALLLGWRLWRVSRGNTDVSVARASVDRG